MLLKPKPGSAADSPGPVVRGLHKKLNGQSPWSWRPLTLITTLVSLLVLSIIVHSSLYLQVDPHGPQGVYMAPDYIKLSNFGTEYSRFAAKYSLYLYKEQGVDGYTNENIGLRGAPVLFLPGNAGSYKQVRSLSSESSRYHFDFLRNDPNTNAGVRPFDFFTIDFNEDFAAFHGQTLKDQAEYVNEAIAYILALYQDARKVLREPDLPDPSSVILIGHSMGGVVARSVLVNGKYQQNSVNTIITMSTPHARPPVSFDEPLVTHYQHINDYWRNSFMQHLESSNPLHQTTLISIAGGGRDTTVPSDYCSISSLVPESHGFTVFTSTIPHVWTSTDHLSITWADQLRKVIVKALYEVVDVRRATQTKPREERMRTFRKWFLTGLENSAPKQLSTTEYEVLLTLGGGSRSSVSSSNNITTARFGVQDEMSARLLRIPKVTNSTEKRFSLLTDQLMDTQGSFSKSEILFCSAFPLSGQLASVPLPVHVDLSDGDASATRLACKKALGDAISLPASTRNSNFSHEEREPFTYLQYDVKSLQEHQFVAVVDKSTEINKHWLHAEIMPVTDGVITVDISLPRLILRGINLELPPSRPLMTEIRIPTIHSSLLAYHLKIRQHGCKEDTELFTPLLRQYIDRPYESKYFVNFKEGDINLHGVAPFMPPGLAGQDLHDGVAFQIWSDPSCQSSIEFRLRADLTGSLGKLVIRYRTMFAVFPLLVVAMVLRKQFRKFDETGIFMSFNESLDQSLRLPLPLFLLSMTIFATAIATTGPAGSKQEDSSNTPVNFAQNDLIMGSQDIYFWFLIPLAGLISVGACVILNYLVLGLLQVFAMSCNVFSGGPRFVKLDNREKVAKVSSVTSTPRRRITTIAIPVLLVATVIPYSFAYVIACIVQVGICTQALRYARDLKSSTSLNFFNYTHSILMFMLWVLPINLPAVLVWVHDLAAHWLTPFSTLHNVLSILPFILLLDNLIGGSMILPRKKFRWLNNSLFFALALYSAFYGMTYAYQLHHIASYIALYHVGLHFMAHGIRDPL